MSQINEKIQQPSSPGHIFTLPKEFSVEILNGNLVMTRHWYSNKTIRIVIASVILNLALIFMALKIIFWICICVPLGCLGLGLTYYTLAQVFNSTTITVTNWKLKVRHQPIPYPGNVQFDVSEIKHVYTKQKFKRQGWTYEVHVTSVNDLGRVLITNLTGPEQAVYIAQQIEQFLGIENKTIADESRKVVFPHHPPNQESWQHFADRNNLSVKAYGIVGNYQSYDFCLLPQRSNREEVETFMRLARPFTTGKSRVINKTKPEQLFAKEDVDDLLDLTDAKFPVKGKIYAQKHGWEVTYKQQGIENNVEYLQYVLDLITTVIQSYPKIVALGGEIVPRLQPITVEKEYFLQSYLPQLPQDKDHPLRSVAIELIRDIGRQTTHLYRQINSLLCKKCLTRCKTHKADVSAMNKVVYYGCRVCHQSREFYLANSVAAVLDIQMSADPIQQDHILRVNWLARRTVFDFDSVEIIDATDEDIERLVVQIGNDTDSMRQPRYKNMSYLVSSQCQLSPNSLRVLQRTFGRVEMISST